MSSFVSARKALKDLSQWARLLPTEPIGLGVERRNDDWVVVVTIDSDYQEHRKWPRELDDTTVVVEHHALPTLRLRQGPRKLFNLG
jgi:hypothetical protein